MHNYNIQLYFLRMQNEFYCVYIKGTVHLTFSLCGGVLPESGFFFLTKQK